MVDLVEKPGFFYLVSMQNNFFSIAWLILAEVYDVQFKMIYLLNKYRYFVDVLKIISMKT